MESTNNKTNYLAIVTSAVAGMVIGFLWYGVIFVKQWMEGNGITMDETKTKAFKNGVAIEMEAGLPYLFNFLSLVFYAFVINWLLKRCKAVTLQDGAMIGGAIGLISLIGTFTNNMFSFTPTTLSMVDGSYVLVMFTVMGAILGGWQKR